MEQYLAEKHIDEILQELRAGLLAEKPASVAEYVLDHIEGVVGKFNGEAKERMKKRGRKNAMIIERRESSVPLPQIQEHTPEQKALILKALASSQLTFELTIDILEVVANYMTQISYPAGTDIITEGEKGNYFYILYEGVCDVYKKDTGEERRVNTIEPGLTFGELALVNNSPRRATVRARGDVVCFRLHGDNYRKIVSDTMSSRIEKYVKMLDSVPLMKNLLPQEKSMIASSLKIQRFEKDTVIIRQGDIGEGFYMITAGRVVVTRQLPDGTTKTLCELKAGATFGEASLLTSEPRNATVTAIDGLTECAVIDRYTFLGVIGPIANIIERV